MRRSFARKEGVRSVSWGEGPVRWESAGDGGKGEGREDAEDDGADAESATPAMGAVSTRGEPSKDDAARTGCERYRNMIS
jgi:hypothetical protein